MGLTGLIDGTTVLDQLALRNEAHRLVQLGVENFNAESERLASALTSIPLGELNDDGAAAVVYTARLLEGCGRGQDVLRLLSHFEDAIRELGDARRILTICLRQARAYVSSGHSANALVKLAAAAAAVDSRTPASNLSELWMIASAAWTEAGIPGAALHAARKVLATEERASNGDGYQPLAACLVVESYSTMGDIERAIEEGLAFTHIYFSEAPTAGYSAARFAQFYLTLVRLLVRTGRLAEANDVVNMAKVCAGEGWPTAGRLLALIIATCAGAVGDTEKVDKLTEPVINGPGIEDSMRKKGRRVAVVAKREVGSRADAVKRAREERRALREQRIEQLAAHYQWDIDSGARVRRMAKMPHARAATWLLDNVAGMAGLRHDPSGTRMAVAGSVARAMALRADSLDITPDTAEVSARLALIGYLFVPNELLMGTSGKDARTASVAVSFLASQGAGELLCAFDDELLNTAGKAAQELRLRSRSVDRTCVAAGPNAPLLSKLIAVALTAAEACIGSDGADVDATALRAAVKRAERWLDPQMVALFSELDDASLNDAGVADARLADSARAHRQLLSALVVQ